MRQLWCPRLMVALKGLFRGLIGNSSIFMPDHFAPREDAGNEHRQPPFWPQVLQIRATWSEAQYQPSLDRIWPKEGRSRTNLARFRQSWV